MSHKSLDCIYLHGFASGPASTKARYFRTKLQELGLKVHVPDLNGNNFAELTLTGQLGIIDDVMREGVRDSDVVLMGSSMGGLLSVLAHDRYPNVRAMVLLAPGFGLNKRWHELLGADKLHQWRDEGITNVFHYGMNQNVGLNYAFIEDAERYQTEDLKVRVPTLIMHGVGDTVVPPAESRRFRDLNQELVELHVLNSDHGLIDVLEDMWSITNVFLGNTLALIEGRSSAPLL